MQLLSLKAELLRKQEEVNKIKKPQKIDLFAAHNPKRISAASSHRSDKKKNETPPKSNAEKTANEKQAAEDFEMLAKSKKVLEAKAKLYDKMTNSGGSLNSDDTCLVRFNKKKQDERSHPVESSDSESDVSEQSHHTDPDDDQWTEYTDCFGRTRKCHKDDLEFFKKKDRDLADVAKSRTEQSVEREPPKQPWFVDTKGISSGDLPLYQPSAAAVDDDAMSLMSKSSKMEEMRQQWEHKELDNLNRDQIHYQDVLFDEARTHGVGYYSFSTDTTERLKQQKVLEEEREKTLEEQRKREQVRLNREKMIADRVFAAKNRQRARLGLEPLPREQFEKAENKEKADESKEERKEKKREEKERRKQEKLEKERDEKRQQHLRPWDHGKDGASNGRSTLSDEEKWEYRPEKPEPLSQQQWNELNRTERNPDFAPPKQRSPSPPPPPTSTESFNRFTTIKPKPIKRRNEAACANMFNEPIQNELDGNDFPVDQDETNKRRRAEVPPPPLFEYYGPAAGSRPKTHLPNANIGDSIEAGLRFLREKSDKSAPGTKQSWVANTTYEE